MAKAKMDLSGFEVQTVKTPIFTMAFPHVGEPDENEKYGFAMYFSDTKALKPLTDEIARVVRDAFDGEEPEHMPLREVTDDEHDNYWWTAPYVMKANTTTKRPIRAINRYQERLDVDNSGMRTPEIIAQELYAGCQCKARVRVVPWANKGKTGISLYIDSVLKVSDGQRIGGGPDLREAFADDFDEAPAKPAAKGPEGPTMEDVKNAFSGLSRQERRDMLTEFSVETLEDLPRADWAEFIAACN